MPTVNLSALAGAGQQFFSDNGVPLSGGKLYSYEAGTTTPQTTYTSANGVTAHANPIVLNSAGRVATGEIWLTAGQNYKFVLKTSTDITIATWDNITGINGTGITSNAISVEYDPPFTGSVATNVEVALARTISVDDFGADPTGVSNSYAAIQAALNYAIPLGLNVCGNGKYISNQTILIPEYRTSPPATFDWPTLNFTINQLTYTGTTGAAIQVESPSTTVYVKKLIGPGGSTATSGLTIIGQGDPEHRVDVVRGFGVNINVLNAYSHTIWIGYCDNSDTGVLLTDSNHIKLYAGRIGGQFTLGSVAIDPTSCEIGVKIMGGLSNEVHATIEYCKRSINAVGLYDNGYATYYIGYLEGSSAYNLYAIGYGGRYYSFTATNRGPSGIYLENDNQFFLTRQQVQEQVTPAGNNTTLTFDTPSKFETEGFAKINGVQGYTEQQITALADVCNEIIYSSDLTNAAWAQSTIGSANWGAVTITANQTGFVEVGYGSATKFVFPGLPADNDIYRIGQSNRITRVGPLNYGIWIWVESGGIDVQVRIVETANNKQSKQVVRLGASNKWVNVAARYMKTTPNASDVLFELQFRTTVGATVRIANTYLVTDADVFFAPLNVDNILKKNIKGVPVNGTCFEQGVRINGALQNQIALAISSAGQFLLSKGNYPVYIVTGGWTGNLFLEDSIYEGQRVVIKRDGVAATGTMQLIPVGTIDGTATPINIAPAYTTLEVIWSTTAAGWLRLN